MVDEILVRIGAGLRAGQAFAFRLAVAVFQVIGRIGVKARREREILVARDRNVNRAGLIQLHQDRTEDKAGRERADQDRDLLRFRRRADQETGL